MRLLVIMFLFSNVCFAEDGDKKFMVSRDEIDQQLSDFDKEIKEWKAIPTIRNGKIVGYTGRPKKNANKPSVFDNIRLVPSDNDSSQNIHR